jgi:hypothetical protein
MWLLAFAIYVACKVLSWCKLPRIDSSAWRLVAYLVAWPGLNAGRFLNAPNAPIERPLPKEWMASTLNLGAGAFVFWSAHVWIPASSPIALGWAGMVGTVLMLHFGVFHLLSCIWRARGIDARPIMNEPMRSTSLTEFWSNRWNTAFRDLTHQFLFGPLARRWGLTAALVIGFAFSGIVHDLVISVPAQGGYGGPTLFFFIQGLAILLERSPSGKSLGLGIGWRGRVFTALVLLMPIQLLFHDQFVRVVVLPFMRAFGAA